MGKKISGLSRRNFLKGTAAAIGLGSVSAFPFSNAFAADFPAHDLDVVVPTRAGGGADRALRAYAGVWKKYIKADIKPSFYPGAGGQVGYQIYLGKKTPDCHNLLFGNMGPETIMYVLQKPEYKFPGDYVYFARVDVEPCAIWVRADSPFKSIENLVEESKKRVINMSVSRMPHPASIGALALAEATGAKFNLIPYGGGNPTVVAVMTGEVEASSFPMAGPVSMKEQVRILGLFSHKNPIPERSNKAPAVNDVFGTKIPDLPSSRAFGLHTKAIEKYPERFEILKESIKKVFPDPEYKAAWEKTGRPWEFISYADQAVCMEYAQNMIDLANRFHALLSAKKAPKKKKK